jgi:hypothetical protein
VIYAAIAYKIRSASSFSDKLRNIDQPIAFIELEDRLVKETYSNTFKYQFPIHSGTLLTDFKFNPKATPTTTTNNSTTTTNNTGQTNATNQTPRSQQQQPTRVVAPNGKEPSISISTSVISVHANFFKRNGNEISFDMYISNKTDDLISVATPANIYDYCKMEAFGDDGTQFRAWQNIQVYQNGKKMQYDGFYCHPGVPVKLEVRIVGVPSSVKYFPLIVLPITYNDITSTYNKAVLKFNNWIAK